MIYMLQAISSTELKIQCEIQILCTSRVVVSGSRYEYFLL